MPSEHWLFPGPCVLLEAFSTRRTFVLAECFLVLLCVLTHTVVHRGLEDTQAHTAMGWKNKHPFLSEESQNVFELCLILCTSLASKEKEAGVKNASFFSHSSRQKLCRGSRLDAMILYCIRRLKFQVAVLFDKLGT